MSFKKVTTFKYDDGLKRKLDELKKHFQIENIGNVTQSDVIRLAICEMYKRYICSEVE